MALELNAEYVDSMPAPAATVMVLRDSAEHFEVLLLRRHAAAGVLGGAYVFPGGKLEQRDRQLSPSLVNMTTEQLRSALCEPDIERDTACQIYAAAVRETLEECGLLLGIDGLPDGQALVQAQGMVNSGLSLDTVLAHFGWRLNASSLLPWSRWITPRRPTVTNRRFDTRFFVSSLPPNQMAVHDQSEVTDCAWMQPRIALERYWAGAIDLAAPQIICLQHLAQFTTIDQVMAYARSHSPRTIRPESFDQDGERVMCYPGDPMHSCLDTAWEGPTRLTFRNGRFEPDGGLKALIAR
ncbi:NUDIX hydrolase [Hydrogenophaga aromaticivorans]|nr:NUDIX hydrolase [Hydrogenophaga aromaticivorans]